MKRTPPLKAGLAAAALILVLNTANAASYSVGIRSDVHPGKYMVTPDASLTGQLGTYATVATTGTFGNSNWSFWSFCLEKNEYFQSEKTYGADISPDYKTTGGINGPNGSGNPDQISMGTAYLYQQFALGNLGTLMSSLGQSFDYANVTNGGARLQNSIWALEGELSIGSLDSGLEALLLNKFGDSTSYLADYHGTSVGVLNITKSTGTTNVDTLSGTARQDQLFFRGGPENIPPPSVPDGGTTLLLLSLSLGGLGLCKRKKKA